MNDPYVLKWHKSVDGIDHAVWDQVYEGQSVVKRHSFTRSVESSGLEGVDYRYLQVTAKGETLALVSCFLFKVELDLLAPEPIRRAVAIVRRSFPSFLRPTLLFVGSPIATCENHVGIDLTKIPKQDLPFLGQVIFDAIRVSAKKNRCFLSIVKELPQSESDSFTTLFGNQFTLFPSLPTSRIPLLAPTHPYPSMLRRSYRKRFKRAVSESENAGLSWRFESDYEKMAGELYGLYFQVYSRSANKFEKLTEQFFASLAANMPQESCALTCRHQDGKLIAACLLVEDEFRMIPLYIGLDYASTEGTTIYYNVLFRSVLEAERRGKRCVVLGQTSYLAKAYSGSMFESLSLGLHSNSRLGRFLIRRVFRLLFRDIELPPTVHSEEIKNDPAFVAACQFR